MPTLAHWSCPPSPHAASEGLVQALGISRPLAAILARRGLSDPDAARAFLRAADRHDPALVPGMGPATELVLRRLEAGTRIVVHGDYDADGVCATAVLVRGLRRLGAAPRWHLPSRDDGYGLSAATVQRLAGEGVSLLVTADCGVTAGEEVAQARRLGLDVVVTDHHRPEGPLPDCPVVHPGLGGYPSPGLCGAAVAHKLVAALHRGAGIDPAAADDDLDLVGLATVADLVPLVGESRRLAREGLRALARTRKEGLRALVRRAGVDPSRLDARAASFALAPRLNAPGRLGRADAALELLLCEDPERAAQIAEELDGLNADRRHEEQRVLFAAEAERSRHDGEPAYVVAGEGWHPGVVGIVASRLVERHHRPCLVISLDGERARGSGRSIAAFDLHAGLAACRAELRRFGGHRAAAGFELDAERVSALRRAFVHHAASVLSPSDLRPVERVDAVLPGGALGLPLAEELEALAPFGPGNPEPTLLVPAGSLRDVRALGEGEHARFTLLSGGARARAIAFRTSPAGLARQAGEPRHLAVRLAREEWNGTVEARLELRACCEPQRAELRLLEEPFWEALEGELQADIHAIPAGAPAGGASDRRGEGMAGVAGELLATGEPTVLVCADVHSRRAGLEALLAGLAPEGTRPAIASWDALADPALARGYRHLVAIDPPPEPTRSPPGALLHLAWGPAEAAFALERYRHLLDVAATARALYRDLLAGEGGEEPLRGAGRRPRTGRECGRALRVLAELGLAERASARSWKVRRDAPRTDLDRSPAHRAYAARLARVEGRLAAELPPAAAAA